MDLTSADSKASYEKIQAYVLEHNGQKVSKLCIAQVKRANEKRLFSKCEIIERENYNLPKFEDAR